MTTPTKIPTQRVVVTFRMVHYYHHQEALTPEEAIKRAESQVLTRFVEQRLYRDAYNVSITPTVFGHEHAYEFNLTQHWLDFQEERNLYDLDNDITIDVYREFKAWVREFDEHTDAEFESWATTYFEHGETFGMLVNFNEA